MIQRRSGTLWLLSLLSGSKRSLSHFRKFELTAEGQEYVKMMFSYEDNYTVLQKYEHIGLKQNVLRSITLHIIT